MIVCELFLKIEIVFLMFWKIDIVLFYNRMVYNW